MFVSGGSEVSLEHLEEEISELAGHLHAGTARWLELVAEFDRRRGWAQAGCLSCSAWLSWQCGISPRAARDQVRVAGKLAELPAIAAAFRRGELSYSKVRALARIATSEGEAELLELALHSTAAQLERIVTATRGCLSREDAQLQHERRYFSHGWDDDGSLYFSGRLSAEEGALLLNALSSARAGIGVQGGSAEPPVLESRTVSNADCLVAVAQCALAGQASTGGSRPEIVLHVDADALESADGPAQLENGPRVAADTARRLSCDAAVVSIPESGGRQVSGSRRTRTIPPAVRRALRSRDPGCRFPGCTNHRFVDAHHIHHWADGGKTSLDNLVHLCRRHHRLLHEGGFRVHRRADGELDFLYPNGSPVPATGRPTRGDPREIPGISRRRGVGVDAWTSAPRTYTARLDLGLAVDAALTATAGALSPPATVAGSPRRPAGSARR